MSGRRFRWLGCGLLATAGVGLLALTSMMHSALDGLQGGNLLDAIGNPIAADMALVPFALGFGILPIVEAGAITVSEFASLIP